MELCSMLCASLDGRGVWERMDTWTCMAEPLHCSPENITTLLIGYTPIQNKHFKPLYLWTHQKYFILSHKMKRSSVDNFISKPNLGTQFSSVQFSRSVVSNSLQPYELQHARPHCPSSTSRVYLNLCPIELVMPSSHLILCRPLLLRPPIPPSIRVFLPAP